jgi:enamine deaminase RidA (YjgF/YER057c/UK114 family)
MSHSIPRRQFVRDGFLLTAGVCGGALAPGLLRNVFDGRALAEEDPPPGRFERRLRELGLELPPQSNPVAVYVPAVVTGNLLFTAGHIPRTPDGEIINGRIGTDLTLEQGAEAARMVGLHILGTVRGTLGSLDRVVRLVKVLGMVNCTPEFTAQSQVVNGFSELMVQVFGDEAGKAARSAVGMGSLPLNAAVEIEAIFEIRTETP